MLKPAIFLSFGLLLVLGFLALSNSFELLKPGPALRPAAPLVSPEVTLLFVGDIMLARQIGQIAEQQGDWRYPFLKAADFLRGADLTFANLENPVSSRGVKVGSIYSFRARPEMLAGLKDAGIDIVNLANNHIWDYGRAAVLDTFKNLEGQGLAYVGAGVNYEAAHAALIKEINGVKIAFFGYTNLIAPGVTTPASEPAAAFIDSSVIAEDIKNAKAQADTVIVNFHWGEEYQTRHNAFQERVAHAAIDAGADLIVGHHPHVPQDIEQYQGKWIVYSLGNFVFDQNFSEDTGHGLILGVEVFDGKISAVTPKEIKFTKDFQPFFSEKRKGN